MATNSCVAEGVSAVRVTLPNDSSGLANRQFCTHKRTPKLGVRALLFR